MTPSELTAIDGPGREANNLDNVLNFRDVGQTVNDFLNAKIVREGLLFRSARLDDASPRDRDRLQGEFGIKTVLDLRTKTEQLKSLQNRRSNLPPQIPGVNYLSIKLASRRFELFLLLQLSFFNIIKFLFLFLVLNRRIQALSLLGQHVMTPRGLLRLGLDTLDHSQPEISACLHSLLPSSSSSSSSSSGNPYPVLIHCTQGKDRTGLIVILTLLILSSPSTCSSSSSSSSSSSTLFSTNTDIKIPLSAISNDYHLTDQSLSKGEGDGDLDSRLSEIRELNLPDSFAYTSPNLVGSVLDRLDSQYGGLDSYLDRISFSERDRNELRETLLY